ncbi:MAG: hypothetical protein WD097_06830 [Balneolales bacterium]
MWLVLGIVASYFYNMRIDPKYFNHFLFIVAVIGFLVIGLASLLYIGKQEKRFIDRLEGTLLREFTFTNGVGDTVQVQTDRTTVLLFWATWSERSLEAVDNLYTWHDANPDIYVISAYVKDAYELAEVYNRPGQDQFQLLNATGAYQDLRVPGVPTVIIFDMNGKVMTTEIGYREIPLWHTLTTRQMLYSHNLE